MKKWVALLAVCFCMLLTSGTFAYAMTAISEDRFVLMQAETHEGDLFIDGRDVVIEGTINGDLYVVAETLQVTGTIKGDIFSVTEDTNISGTVDGNLRTISRKLTTSGIVNRNVTAMMFTFLLQREGQVKGSLYTLAETVDLLGKVGKDTNALASQLRIAGMLDGGTTYVNADQITVDATAVIGGDFRYKSTTKAIIQPGAQLQGKEIYTPYVSPNKDAIGINLTYTMIAMSLLSTLVLWLLLRYLFPAALVRVQQKMRSRVSTHLGIGALILFGTPISALIFLITVVGAPIAAILILALGILLYVAKVFVGSWAGHALSRRFNWRIHPMAAEFIGVLGLFLLTQLPSPLGWLVSIATGLLFLGAIAACIKDINVKEKT